MKGIETVVKYGLLAEKSKWDVEGFDYSSQAALLSTHDKELIIDMDKVGDGELSGMGMMLILHKLVLTNPEKYTPIFYETLMFSSYVLIYEEFRHGLFLKELFNTVSGLDSFKDNVAPSVMAEEYINMPSPWNDPYEALVSFLLGEVTNTVIYREAAKVSESEWLKQKFMNISKDESRHKAAWRDLCKKVCSYSEESRLSFIEAFKRKHMVHQAEVHSGYGEGVTHTNRLFSFAVMREIHDDKMNLLEFIVGDSGIDSKQLLGEHILHLKEVMV